MNASDVKVYTVNGAAAGTGSASSLPDWLTRKRAVKSGRSKRAIREEIEGAVNLIQDFEFPEASNRIKVTRDGHHAIATGVYKPQMRVYDLDQLTLKFERHSDSENVDFLILSDDWTKTIHLQADRTIEIHNQSGLHYKTRIPRFGRALGYLYTTCDAFFGGTGNEIYRLNLELGRFMTPLILRPNSGEDAVEGVNAIDINPAHNLLAFATDGPSTVEFWDPRSRSSVGNLKLPRSLVSPSVAAASLLPGVDNSSRPLSATALSSRSDGISFAVGTSTGHTLLYDIRSPKPYATKDQGYGLPIKQLRWIEGGPRMAGDNFIFSADKKVLKIWNRESPSTNFASVTTPTDINDVCHIPGSGLFMLANEGIHMTSYYIPQLGPAPKWCSFLDNITEEMEDQTIRNTYEDFKFIERSELSSLGLESLLGTPAVKPYMHGYFISLKLYDAARVIANPFVYAEHREKSIREKMEKLADSRIRTKKNNMPKINRALAQRIVNIQEKERNKKRKRGEAEDTGKTPSNDFLQDPRFKAAFEDPDFEIDETSKEFALLHPSQADAATKGGRKRTMVEEEEEESDVGLSSDDLGGKQSSNATESDESNSSEEDMEMVDLRGRRPPTEHHTLKRPKGLPKLVSARAEPESQRGSSTRRNDPSASFGQRRKDIIKPKPTQSQQDEIVARNTDGGMTISWIPESKGKKSDEGDTHKSKIAVGRKKNGIEYLGSGLERGAGNVELPEMERKGRTSRRQGIRSGSKNAFRKL